MQRVSQLRSYFEVRQTGYNPPQNSLQRRVCDLRYFLVETPVRQFIVCSKIFIQPRCLDPPNHFFMI